MTALALLFTLAAIGIAITTYLVRKRVNEEVPICFVGQNCHAVLTSKYNKILGLHNDVLGLVYYSFEAVVTGLLVLEFMPYLPLELIAFVTMLIGAVLSVYFTYLQAFVLKAWCFWCLMSAFTAWGMAAIILFK